MNLAPSWSATGAGEALGHGPGPSVGLATRSRVLLLQPGRLRQLPQWLGGPDTSQPHGSGEEVIGQGLTQVAWLWRTVKHAALLSFTEPGSYRMVRT